MRDPVERQSDGTRDLYDIATWEPRSLLDRLSVRVYHGLLAVTRAVVVLAAVVILLSIIAQGIGATFARDPYSVGLVVMSVVPAALIVAYVYAKDVTTSEPLSLLVGTFVLGVLFAGFAAIVNALLQPVLVAIPAVGILLFFYLVVGPAEETVKWLAVRLYAYRDDRFDAVVDGAVYGAAAGLGFATIENALYITQNLTPTQTGNALVVGALAVAAGALQLGGVESLLGNIIGAGGQITALRALAGPGHVIYSAFAGYYLGLAKFNRRDAGPIVVKGLIVAALIHATYNTLVGIVPVLVSNVVNVNELTAFFAFVLVYDGVFLYVLYRKLSRYGAAYRATAHGRRGADPAPERTEFER